MHGNKGHIDHGGNALSEPQGGHSVIAGAGASDSAPKAASRARSPLRDSDGIDVGDVVLATTGGTGDGWFECVVIEALGDDLFELRWRDYNEPHIIRRRTALGLLPPS